MADRLLSTKELMEMTSEIVKARVSIGPTLNVVYLAELITETAKAMRAAADADAESVGAKQPGGRSLEDFQQ